MITLMKRVEYIVKITKNLTVLLVEDYNTPRKTNNFLESFILLR